MKMTDTLEKLAYSDFNRQQVCDILNKQPDAVRHLFHTSDKQSLKKRIFAENSLASANAVFVCDNFVDATGEHVLRECKHDVQTKIVGDFVEATSR